MRVLCLDIEGGYGGSSRSLFEALRRIPRSGLYIEVWHRKSGPITAAYGSEGIIAKVTPSMPKATSVELFSRNCIEFGRFIINWSKSYGFRKDLLGCLDNVDLIHFNHEGLFLLAWWLRRFTTKPMTMHIRTIPPESIFSRWQARMIARSVNSVVMISEQEAKVLEQRIGRPTKGRVIYNPVSVPLRKIEPHSEIPQDNRLRLASLSNFALLRGVDRLVDVAVALKKKNRKDILFVLAGNMDLPGSLPGELGNIKKRGGDFKTYVSERGVADLFLFLGHTHQPERVIAGCDALIKLGRGLGGWGRDILESLAAEKPVLSVSTDNKFLENEKTGILFSKFDANDIADAIIGMANDRLKLKNLGKAGKDRIISLCDPKERALDLLSFWQEALNKAYIKT